MIQRSQDRFGDTVQRHDLGPQGCHITGHVPKLVENSKLVWITLIIQNHCVFAATGPRLKDGEQGPAERLAPRDSVLVAPKSPSFTIGSLITLW